MKKSIIKIEPLQLKSIVWTPTVEHIFKETHSQMILEEDETAVQIKFIKENLTWLKFKLRDRLFDGPSWRPTKLTDWPYNGPDDKFTMGRAIEESTYFLDPRRPLTDRFTQEQAEFIKNPFEALPYSESTKKNLAEWLERWKKIVSADNRPFPGYFCLEKIYGLRKHVHNNNIAFCRELGYKYLTCVPTWWHVAELDKYLGFIYLYQKDAQIIDEIKKLLARAIGLDNRAVSSWIVMLQFWAELVENSGLSPSEFKIVDGLILRDKTGNLLTYPLSPNRNLWMVYKL